MRTVLSCVVAGVAALALAACAGDDFESGFGGGGAGGDGGSGAGTTGTAGSGGDDGCDCQVGSYVPICGVDGVTYDAACGIHCVPVAVACEQECPCPSCEDLEAQYRAALEEAKVCNPTIDMEQCTSSAPDELGCPCDTFVNPDNTAALTTLGELRDQWEEMDCQVPCPGVECEVPAGGHCVPMGGSGSTGGCHDLFAEPG